MAQYAVTGCLNGSYYADATQQLVHPSPATPQRAALYAWLCGRACEKAALPETVAAFEEWKESRVGALPDMAFQMLTAQPLTDAQWGEIARPASWQMTRMNLNTFLRNGVFESCRNSRVP